MKGVAGDVRDANGRATGSAEGTSGGPKRDEVTRSWTERALTPPGPDSPFYVPPPSTRALRWLIGIFLLSPAVLVFAVVMAALEGDATLVGMALVLLCLVGALRACQIRTILQELARRRTEESGSPAGRS
jgi:hypothetical protein